MVLVPFHGGSEMADTNKNSGNINSNNTGADAPEREQRCITVYRDRDDHGKESFTVYNDERSGRRVCWGTMLGDELHKRFPFVEFEDGIDVFSEPAPDGIDCVMADHLDRLATSADKAMDAAGTPEPHVVKSDGYANRMGYTDVHPFEIVQRVTKKAIHIRAMHAVVDPEFKPEMHAGGFVAHCSNQHEQ